MKNRGILARMSMKGKKKKEVKKAAAKKVVLLKDPETNEVMDKFPSMEKAVEAGFNLLNIKKAIKNGTKYKGYLWESSK